MRILLDHNVPRKLRRFLPGHYIQTSREAGWDDLSDSELLLEAERAAYEVFITGDQSLTSQQNLTGVAFAIVVLEETIGRHSGGPLVASL